MKRTLLSLVVFGWLACSGAPTAPPRTSPQEPGAPGAPTNAPEPPPKLEGLVEATLPNGLRVYLYPLQELPLVSVRLVLPAGSAYEPPGKRGLAALTAEVLPRGAPGASSPQERAERLGATLSVSPYIDDVQIGLDGLARDQGALLDLLAEVVMRPSLAAGELEHARQALADEGEVSLDDPAALAQDAARGALFAGHPYARPALGVPDDLRSLSAEDVAAFHRARYRPGGASLVIVGDIDPGAARKAVEARFGAWEAGTSSPGLSTVPPPAPGRRVLLVDLPGASAELVVAAPAREASIPEAAALDLINDGLGGGFSSRLLDELRVNRGLVYDVSSRFERHPRGGWFLVQTSVPAESTREALDLILKALADFRAVGASRADLDGARAFFLAEHARLFESPNRLAGALAGALGDGSGAPYLAAYRARLRQLDSTRSAALRGQHFPGGTNDVLVVVVGDAAFLSPLLESLGPVQVITPGTHWGE